MAKQTKLSPDSAAAWLQDTPEEPLDSMPEPLEDGWPEEDEGVPVETAAVAQMAPAVPSPAPILVQLTTPPLMAPGMHEAPYSATVSVEDEDGYHFLLTVRKTDGKE